MLTLFKKLFGKSTPTAPSPVLPSAATISPAQMQFESAIQMAKVEVAKLSLKAIAAKLPEDIRALLNSAPDDETTVALPIQTIIKQLPSGVVRMSLASLHRQAPQGLFKALPAGDKRMVEVPLVEVFKHVKPTALKRRNDQRQVGPIEDEFEAPVFNSRVEGRPVPPAEEKRAAEPAHIDSEAAPAAMRVVAPPSDLNLASTAATPKPTPQKPGTLPAKLSAPAGDEPAISLPLSRLSDGWPSEIATAIADLDPTTTVSVPHSHIAPGLARGKITCTWKQLSAWLIPPPQAAVAIAPDTTLVLPLKVIAPAFLAASKPTATPRKSVTVDDTIPALFSGGRQQATSDTPAVETPKNEDPAPPEPKAPDPVVGAEEPREATVAVLAEPEKTIANESAEEPPKAESSEPEARPDSARTETIGQALGEPDRTTWTPAALVNAVVKLPGVSGAIVGLQEGFQVAHALPDGVNAETISAFLPQIFTRLNQYAAEMKLGDVDDLLFTTRGAHCLIYRLGNLYFAVLGKPGESLPWSALRLVAAELSRQVTH